MRAPRPEEGVTPQIHIRPFDSSEWALFRYFRLHALQSAPSVFSASYANAVESPPEHWQDYLSHERIQRVFGLFDGETLIGITAAFTFNGDPTGETAILAMSFIEPEYRGQGLSRLLYQARLDWIRSQPQFKRVLVGHRESNQISRRANQHFGFAYAGREPHDWPDGTSEDELLYELVIQR